MKLKIKKFKRIKTIINEKVKKIDAQNQLQISELEKQINATQNQIDEKKKSFKEIKEKALEEIIDDKEIKDLQEKMDEKKKQLTQLEKQKIQLNGQVKDLLDSYQKEIERRTKYSKLWYAGSWLIVFIIMMCVIIVGYNLNVLYPWKLSLYLFIEALTFAFFVISWRNLNYNADEFLKYMLDSKGILPRKKTDNNLENYLSNHPLEALSLPAGTVRAFLMVVIAVIIAEYVFNSLFVLKDIKEIIIPLHFLIALNIILVYYEIKPAEVLPSQLVIKIPENYGTIDRIPLISQSIDYVITSLENIKNDLEKTSNKFKDNLTELKKSFGNKYNQLIKKIDSFSETFEKLRIKSKSLTEQIGLMMLLIIVAIISSIFLGFNPNTFNAITIGFASFLAVISIAFGINIQEIILKKVKPKLQTIFEDISNTIYEIQASFEIASGQIKKLKEDIEHRVEELKANNILAYLPKDVVAAISINLITLFCGLSLIVQGWSTNSLLLVGVEFIVGYYFLSKK